jgi:hypothetical protein
MTDFGTIVYDGVSYTLDDQAEPTSRLIPGPWNYHDVEEGEEYQMEYAAPAHDAKGNEYRVCWLFWLTKGDEPEPDSLDWSAKSIDRVEVK